MLCTTSIILPKQAGRRLAKGYPRAYSHSSSAPYKKDKLYMIAEELHISNEFRNNLRLSSFALCIVLFLLRSFFQNRLVDNSLLSIAKHSLSLSMISLFVFIFNYFWHECIQFTGKYRHHSLTATVCYIFDQKFRYTLSLPVQILFIVTIFSKL